MKAPLPSSWTLIAFAGAAALLVAAGWQLARSELEVRITPDRTAVKDFARQLQTEVSRLETAYAGDLREVAATVSVTNPDDVRKRCGEFFGIRGVCELRPEGAGSFLRVDSLDARALPTIEVSQEPVQGRYLNRFLLPRNLIFPRGNAELREGRVEADGSPFLVYWRRRADDRAVALLIERDEIRELANSHLQRWIAPRFAGVSATRGLDRVESGAGDLLAGIPQAPERPAEFVIPFVTSFGDWQIASWDRIERRVVYRPAPLIVASVCAGILILIDLSLARQQRRAQRLAEQRVSFVNQVSHELGTPLTNALLNLDLAAEQMAFQPSAPVAGSRS